MSRIIKRRYKATRKQFKADLYQLAKSNNAVPILITETYVAKQCRKHIGRIWRMLGKYKDAYKDYSDNLFGKAMTGESGIMRSLYFADEKLYSKYHKEIPDCYAMGDAVAIAYRVQREQKAKGV